MSSHSQNVGVTRGIFCERQDRPRSFAEMTAIDTLNQNITGDGEPQHVVVGAVSRGFGGTAGVQPVAGRLFAADEFQPGHEMVALISHALWATRYGGAAVGGRPMALCAKPYTIVAGMPP